ncbi:MULTISPECIES: hypothetical protein [unclassified Pseudomonas]|uniref:hypothetical protein n=1 Tax=unclassified Pseudomonas TaxID=196821 RepID=UPI0024480171|nr:MULTISPECIES: hypothetical protein [unclassified Pseudomonas]MDH0305106.1 hypothetical protein [Pseudomonas sp. GD04091]MDH1985522.1 hypothetical protein [Pseudomonas sp. GD03689]
MNDNLHQRPARFSNLDCKVARRFDDRPVLLDAADRILSEQWQQYLPGDSHDPLTLYLASRHPRSGSLWIRPLSQVLVERYCQRQTLNLDEGVDFVSSRVEADQASRVSIDLHQVELLVNEAAPTLLEVYRRALTAYWSHFDKAGQTPWHWFAQYLRGQFQEAIAAHRKARSLPDFALAAIQQVHEHPDADARSTWEHAPHLTVSHLAVDFSADAKLDSDLASALLVEYADDDPGHGMTLLFTLAGKLHSFPSRQQMLTTIGRYWPAGSHIAHHVVHIVPTTQGAFEIQALGLLDQQLRLIEHLAGQYRSKLDALNMSLALDRLTSMIDLCSDAEASQRRTLSGHLPAWLRNARGRPLMRYSNLLIDVAQGYLETQGTFWLDGIDNAQTFANRQLAARFSADHPGDSVDPAHVRIINYQTTATASAGQGGIITSGEVTPVSYSLAQLAIGNLGLLRPGRVEVGSTAAGTLPDWLDAGYLRKVVSELDIATVYPAMLRDKLLGDQAQRKARQRLLVTQLRNQLPALAQELYLREKLPDQEAASHIAQVFSTAGDDDAQRWVMRPLGFIKAPGSPVDHPRNTWLIEPLSPVADTCLLYRPLHEDSLLQFNDRLALFVAISTPGPLQDDMLQRLPAEDRRFYAHGGFLEPHLFVPLDDTSAIPFGTPAPVKLSLEAPVDDPGEALYLACVNESIEHFEEHASTTAQTRWARWREMGWLLFNTLLPLAGGALGKVAWLAQMELTLADFMDSDAQREPGRHQLALVNLLVNIAMLLFSHSILRIREEQGEAPSFPGEAIASPQALPAAAPAVAATSLIRLDFSWARPARALTARQTEALHALRANIDASRLGTPIPSGALRGLYLHGDKLYTRLGDKVYEVMLDMPRNQMRIIGPDLAQGPWLRHDEAGRWQLDLSLALKGGMPLSGQIRALRLEKANALRSVDEQIKADKAAIPAKLKEQTTIESLVAATLDETALQTCQSKLQTLSAFWATHVERLKTRNALQPISNFKTVHAYALYQDTFCQRVLRKVLQLRYQPDREQLLQFARQQQDGADLTRRDMRIASERLDRLVPMIDLMIENNRHLRDCQDALNRLASPQQPEILQWSKLAGTLPATAERGLILRFLRLEALLNRLTLMNDLTDDAVMWRDRFWSNVQLGIAQRAKLFKRTNADEELSTMLLRSILGHFQAAARQLGIFTGLVEGEAANQAANQLQEQLDWLISHISQDLAGLPDYPPTRTLSQMRETEPGLIETSEHGLLLGEPRANDARTVDIAGPDSKTPSRTYRNKKGEWVELKTAAKAGKRASAQQSLTQLLEDSDRLMEQARDEVAKLQRTSASYLPRELEEGVLHQRQRLLEQIDTVEARLTKDNETDEARAGRDAELTCRALRRLADELQGSARTLRISAALAQKPSMGEVMFLVAEKQVQITAVGPRVRLAEVKGRPEDFLDEYRISHAGKGLWYAHFHYATMTAAKADFTAGHLKTAVQRRMSGHRHADGSGGTVEVYRAKVTHAAAAKYFFNR